MDATTLAQYKQRARSRTCCHDGGEKGQTVKRKQLDGVKMGMSETKKKQKKTQNAQRKRKEKERESCEVNVQNTTVQSSLQLIRRLQFFA